MESKLGPATPQDPPPPEQAETQAGLSTCTSEPTTAPVDRPTSPDTALPQQLYTRTVREDDRAAAVVANPPSASPPPPSQLFPAPAPAPAPTPALEEEWEIQKIIEKRRAGKGYEYKVRWKDTWLSNSELGNARRLLQEFEAHGRVQRGFTSRKATRAGKAG